MKFFEAKQFKNDIKYGTPRNRRKLFKKILIYFLNQYHLSDLYYKSLFLSKNRFIQKNDSKSVVLDKIINQQIFNRINKNTEEYDMRNIFDISLRWIDCEKLFDNKK